MTRLRIQSIVSCWNEPLYTRDPFCILLLRAIIQDLVLFEGSGTIRLVAVMKFLT